LPARARRLDTERMEPAPASHATHPETPVDAEADRRAVLTADLILSIVGLLLLVPGVLWLAWMGAWVGSVTGQCQFHACDDGAITLGRGMAGLGPVVVWGVALVASIVVLVLRRRASWIPPVAFLVAIAVLHAGAWIAEWGAGLR
jgi:hypothetical protein